MKTETLRTIIKELAGNTIFSCDFTKKDGTPRTMVCRLGVKKGQNGKGLNYDPVEKGLLPVYDVQKQGYRMINLNSIVEIRAKGQVFRLGEE